MQMNIYDVEYLCNTEIHNESIFKCNVPHVMQLLTSVSKQIYQ